MPGAARFRDLRHPGDAAGPACVRRPGSVIQITFGAAARALAFRTTIERSTGRLAMKRLCFLVVLMVLSSSAACRQFVFLRGRRTPHPHRGAQALQVSRHAFRFRFRASIKRAAGATADDDEREVADQVKAPVAVQPPAPVQAVPPASNPAARRRRRAATGGVQAGRRRDAGSGRAAAGRCPAPVLPPVPPPPPTDRCRDAGGSRPAAGGRRCRRLSSVSHRVER